MARGGHAPDIVAPDPRRGFVEKGTTILLDNGSFHRKERLKKTARKAGLKLLLLPPYSPDFNPIEHIWTNMKRALRDLIPHFDTLESAVLHYFIFYILVT
jgi:transposase